MKADSMMVEQAYQLATSLPQMTIAVIADAILTTPADSLPSELSRRIPHHSIAALHSLFLSAGTTLHRRSIRLPLPSLFRWPHTQKASVVSLGPWNWSGQVPG